MQTNWQPTASINTLRSRAAIMAKIRAFFADRGVLEVETPLLSHTSVNDLHIHSFQTPYFSDDQKLQAQLYLQTSPEYAMKRLLASGCGAIFQICKAFRNQGESGRLHNPEFTMLEWYRPEFNHHDLMAEMEALLQLTLMIPAAEKISYAELFANHLQLDPHQSTATELRLSAQRAGINLTSAYDQLDKDAWLLILMSQVIEPQLGQTCPVFVYDFPSSQAVLAKIRPGKPPVAERFEVYYKGIELANGFHELTDAKEQHCRLQHDLALRKNANLLELPVDNRLIAALIHGLPDCAGVALGIDRLIMLATAKETITDVLSFSLDVA